MNFLARGQRDLVSLECPIRWPVEGARQVEVEGDGARMEETLRSVVAVRPEVIVLVGGARPRDRLLVAQLASSVLVVAVIAGHDAAQAVTALLQMGVPAQLLSGTLAAVTCQRLVRQICRICRQPVGAARAADPRAPRHRRGGGADAAVLPRQGLPDLQQGRLPRPARDLRGHGRPPEVRAGADA